MKANDSENYYYAENSDGYSLTVEYQGYNVIHITVNEPKYRVEIEVDCIRNWFFSQYDVEMRIDDLYEGKIPHGGNENFSSYLTKGRHTVSFESVEDDSLVGKIEIDVTDSITIKLRISCSSSGIDVRDVSDSGSGATESDHTVGVPDDWTNLLEKHYEDVKKQFVDAGFTNIICVAREIDYDENNVFEGSVVNIAIGENGEQCTFAKGEQWPKDTKIRIDYRIKPDEEKPDTDEIVLPREDSKLGRDFYIKSASVVFYVNTDNQSNLPSITTWGSATVTDGVAEYLNYLEKCGFTVTVTDTTHKEPYSGFHTYDTNFKVSNGSVSWIMYLSIQKEKYIEYELDVYLG